jgi:tRNA (guanine26-N2/guanine27-N2)-dimethyltransferase
MLKIRPLNRKYLKKKKMEKIIPKGCKVLQEGQAKVIHKEGEVFYNPLQEFNRDISIVAIKQFIKLLKSEKGTLKRNVHRISADDGINILEGLSATGLRSIRYFKEIEGIKSILVNDLCEDAYQNIKTNLEYNDIDLTKCIPSHADCRKLLYEHSFNHDSRFHVIDIDPYGTASMFMDSAVQAIDNGGMLCITCTDSAILCGSYKMQAFGHYQSMPVNGEHCHEFALRMILKELNAHALRNKRAIEPLLSLSIDFYFRVFVRVHDNAYQSQTAFAKVGNAYQCSGCSSFWTQPVGEITKNEKGNETFKQTTNLPVSNTCPHCGSNVKLGGPIWLGPLHSKPFVNEILKDIEEQEELYKTHKRIKGLLTICQEELDDPLFYSLATLSKDTKLPTPSIPQFHSALITAGYKVSGCHVESNAAKTNAKPEVIWDIMRCWRLQQKPVPDISKTSVIANKILSKEPTLQADFTIVPESISNSSKLPRFIKNPGMGPLARATGTKRTVPKELENDISEKQNSNKKKKEEIKIVDNENLGEQGQAEEEEERKDMVIDENKS